MRMQLSSVFLITDKSILGNNSLKCRSRIHANGKADSIKDGVELASGDCRWPRPLKNSDYYRVSRWSQEHHVSWEQGVKLKRWSRGWILASSYRLSEYLKIIRPFANHCWGQNSPSLEWYQSWCGYRTTGPDLRANGVVMISVLEKMRFSLKVIWIICREDFQSGTRSTLNKVLYREKQIIRARNAGATVILLIVAALSEKRLRALHLRDRSWSEVWWKLIIWLNWKWLIDLELRVWCQQSQFNNLWSRLAGQRRLGQTL